MQQKHNSHKKQKILLAFFLVLSALVISFFVISKIAENKYWSGSHLDDLHIDMSRYKEYLSANEESQSDMKSTVNSCNRFAVAIRSEYEPFFKQCNDIIIGYFKDSCGVDLTEKLGELQILSAEYPKEVAEIVSGSYFAERKAMCINSALLDGVASELPEGQIPSVFDSELFSVKLLTHVYIHETVHYLGFSSSKSKLSSFVEAATEALTEKIMSYGGIKYENITGYWSIKDFAAQILDADFDTVRSVLADDTFSIDARLGEYIGDELAEELNDFLFIVQRGGANQYGEVPYLAQYISFEYVKNVSPDFKKFAQRSAVNFFELKWFFNVYN